MCRRLIYLISFVLVLSSVSDAATIHWTGLGENKLWSNPANWESNKVPTTSDDAYVDVPAAAKPNGPVIQDGIDAKAHGLACEVAGEPTMTMTGGTLEIIDWVWWGDGAGCHGTFYMSGGSITTGGDFELGWGGGEGTWIMTGGMVNIRELIIPTSTGRAGQLYLHGGTFNVRHEGLRMTRTGLIDITKGTLMLEGDRKTQIDGFIGTGQITAYGGAGTVLVTYNGQTTTVVAIGAPEASDPGPAHEAKDVPRDVILSWTPGEYADKHDVYFGTIFNDVNDASRTNPRGVLASFNQDANTYDPVGLLEFGKTYYWRIDEVNAPPTSHIVFKGDVWKFTVEPFAYPIAGGNITATASSQFNPNTGPQNTINGSGLDNNDLHSTDQAAIWLSSMTGPQPTWIQYEFDRVYKLHQMWVWNCNQVIEPVVGFGFKEVTIEYSTNGTDWAVLANVPEFARATGSNGYAHNTTVDLGGALAKYVKFTAKSNWGGILPQYGLSEIRFLYIPVLAREPNPASGATDTNVDNVTLSWRAGREAAKHNVYFSDSNQAVIDGTAPITTVSQASYGLLSLDLGKTYYWRVDEVNEAVTPAIWQGDVWDFSTREFLVVDDFEDYNDFEPDRIFDTWIDGWADPANGSQVGYAVPPFAERTIVHSGKQSMPLSYDNSSTASYSDATANVANLAVGQDWTKYGIRSLTLWFRGDPNNAAERMYVKLNGSKVTYDGDVANLTRTGWQPWNIELSSFSANLRNVTELKIGLERSGAVGGKGKVYFDDIRLYPSAQ